MKDLWRRLDLLERFHLPVYLGQEFKIAYRGGTALTAKDAEQANAETVAIYERCFQEADSVSRKAKVLQSFVSNFPQLAWRKAEWFWNLYAGLRSGEDQNTERLLKAIGRGIATQEADLSKFQRQRRIEDAHDLLTELKKKHLRRGNDLRSLLEKIQGAFKVDRHQIEKSERSNIQGCLLELGCPLSTAAVLKELKRRGIATTLLKVAAATHSVRERDLKARSAAR